VSLADLAAWAAPASLPGAEAVRGATGLDDIAVTGVTLDSRSVLHGDLYAALPGFNVHGATFATGAVTAGAAAVLTDHPGTRIIGEAGGVPVPVLVNHDPRTVLGAIAATVYGNPATALTLFGITGTNGKTTTAYLLESALRCLGVSTGLIGTVETRIGATRLTSVRTTPEATDLHAIFAVMRESGTQAAVMEVSSHALSQHRVDGAVYDVALFTNLSQDHLDFHPTMEDYFAAKAQLFTPEHSRTGVVCVDDRWGQELARTATVPVTTVTSSRRRTADWVVEPGPWPAFQVRGNAAVLDVDCHLPGEFNIVNTAMAAVALVVAGYPPADVEAAMAEEPHVPGRMERVTRSEGGQAVDADPRCIVDYAHTPDAVEAALAALRSTTPGRLIVVLGAGGDRDRGKRRGMGAAAARHADVVIVTDDNPRSEDPAAIRAAVLDGARQVVGSGGVGPTVHGVRDGRGAAIREAVRTARASGHPAKNTVLVLGKGHEVGQDIGGTIHPFDDRDALRAALDAAPYHPKAREPRA
jgi:UDP-N-acetylmuramoyl-L-alanyl-D-glutamate--2,6-diaminopimelate ligase